MFKVIFKNNKKIIDTEEFIDFEYARRRAQVWTQSGQGENKAEFWMDGCKMGEFIYENYGTKWKGEMK